MTAALFTLKSVHTKVDTYTHMPKGVGVPKLGPTGKIEISVCVCVCVSRESEMRR